MFTWTNIPGARTAWTERARVIPRWGVPLIVLSAVPGLAIALLSIALLVASLLALLLLTLPAYKLVAWASGLGRRTSPADVQNVAEPTLLSPGSKPVEVRITDG